MAGEEQLFFPKGFLAMGNGDLTTVTNAKHSLENGGKQVSTIRRPQAGVTLGPGSSSLTFDAVVPETGIERDFYRDCQRGTIRQVRLKNPAGKVLVMNGIFSQVETEFPLDGEVKVSCTFIGKTDRV